MNKRVAYIVNTGFDGSGNQRLGIEYGKLGFDVYFRDVVQPLQHKPTFGANTYKIYTKEEELYDICKNYDRVIFGLLSIGERSSDNILTILKRIKQDNVRLELCYLYCSRSDYLLKQALEIQTNNNFIFDHYFSILPQIKQYVKNSTYLNINAYTFDKYIKFPLTARNNVILTAGRFAALKGNYRLFEDVPETFINSDYIYIHEGAKITFSKSGNVVCEPQYLSLFNLDVKPKKPIEPLRFIPYNVPPIKHKINIYPSYNLDDIYVRWPNYFAGICCILGTKSKCIIRKTLLQVTWAAQDIREDKYIKRMMQNWNNSLEYANFEMISCGLPVFISRHYANLLGFTDENLIYNSFADIPKKALKLNDNYIKIIDNQYEFFVNRQRDINNNIINTFTKELCYE